MMQAITSTTSPIESLSTRCEVYKGSDISPSSVSSLTAEIEIMGSWLRLFAIAVFALEVSAAPAMKNYRALFQRDKFDGFGWSLSQGSSNDMNGSGPSFNPVPSTLNQNPVYSATAEFDFDSLVSIYILDGLS